MGRHYFLTLCLLLWGTQSAVWANPQWGKPGSFELPGGVSIDRVENGIIFFKAPEGKTAPKPIRTGLYSVKVLGPLNADPTIEKAQPYILMIGEPCEGCSKDSAVYAFSLDGLQNTHFVHPGKVLDPKTKAVLIDSRAYYGHCDPKRKGDVYIVYQSEKLDRRRFLQDSVFIAEPGPGYLWDKVIERKSQRPREATTKAQVKKYKVCREIETRNRIMHKRPMDLRPRKDIGEGDDEVSSDEKDEDEKEKEAKDASQEETSASP